MVITVTVINAQVLVVSSEVAGLQVLDEDRSRRTLKVIHLPVVAHLWIDSYLVMDKYK